MTAEGKVPFMGLLAYLDVLDRLSSLSFDQRQYGACVALCRLLVEKDPCREDGHAG